MKTYFQTWVNDQRKDNETLRDAFGHIAEAIGSKSWKTVEKWHYGTRKPRGVYLKRLFAYSGGIITADSFEDYTNIKVNPPPRHEHGVGANI